MTTLYREVLIETAEQAEALPGGTIANRVLKFESTWETLEQPEVAVKIGVNAWYSTAVDDDAWDWLDRHLVGWTALVPIEAEEETAVVIGKAGLNDPAANPYADVCMDSDGNVWFGGDRSMIDVTEEYNEWASKDLSTRYVTEWKKKA